MVITDEVARRLEAAEALDAAGCAEAVCRIYTDCGAEAKAIAGGVATFCGPTSPLTHALSVGMHGPVSGDELDELEEFFVARGAAITLDLCPHADPSLRELINQRGYRIGDLANVLVRELRPDEVWPASAPGVEVAIASDSELYSRLIMCGFFGRDAISDEEFRLGRILFHMPLGTPIIGTFDGQPAGGGGLSLRNRVASLFGDAVLPRFRGRGVHPALIAWRLQKAAEAGCDIATAGTLPGSLSQRNYQKLGFEVAYSKITFVREG